MKAKVIQDGNRVIITFTGIEDPENFVERIVKIVSNSSENEVVPQKVMGLVPVMVEENEESYETVKEPCLDETPKETALFCAVIVIAEKVTFLAIKKSEE